MLSDKNRFVNIFAKINNNTYLTRDSINKNCKKIVYAETKLCDLLKDTDLSQTEKNKTWYRHGSECEEVENLYDGCKSLEELYNNAVNLYENEDYKTALDTINTAFELAKDKELNTDNFKKLKMKIEAEEIYQEMLEIYESENINYELIIENLEYVIEEKCSDEKYSNFLKNVESEYNNIQGENYYKKADIAYQNKNYRSALTDINKALELNSKNETYIALKKKINVEIKNNKFDKYYQKSIEAYNDAQFKEAAKNIENALKADPENEDCKKLSEKIKTRKIDIATCSKNALLTLDVINEEQAENIIQARNSGKIYYDINSFAFDYGLQPHQVINIQDRLIFPPKPIIRMGRKLDI